MSCPDCFRGSIHTHSKPTGTWTTTAGVHTYVAKPDNPSPNGSTILFVCDAFGPKLVNNLLLADVYARRSSHTVLLPDFLGSKWASPTLIDTIDIVYKAPATWWNPFAQLRRLFAIFQVLGTFIPFLLIHAPKKHIPEILAYARTIKSTLPASGKLGVAGFCWGGYVSTALCAEPAKEGGSDRLIDAQFTAHPSALKPATTMVADAVSKYKVPYSLAIGDNDMAFPKKQVDEVEAAVREKAGKGDGAGGYNWEFKVYPGAMHGFAVRASPESRLGSQAAEDAEGQAVEWFKKFL